MIGAHTPGPWPVPHIARDDIGCNCASVLAGEYCGGIAEVYVSNNMRIADGGNDCPPLDEAKANAHLIAAAPEMLDALRRAVLALAFAAETWPVMQDDYEAVSAAIKKATGAPP